MCGFSDSLYFSRMFKKKYGIAPSYYASKSGRNPDETATAVRVSLEPENAEDRLNDL